MNMTSYRLNPEGARKVGTSAMISERGGYIGQFVRAEAVESRQGTQGVEFDFLSDDGQSAKFLTVWTVNGSGVELSGRRMIDAIMTSLGVKAISAQQAVVKKWDTEQRTEVSVRATVFPELMGKRLGLVLNREEYEANDRDHTRKWKNAIVCPFEAATRRLAGERLDNKPALGLDRLLRILQDRPLRTTSGPHHNGNGAQSPDQGGSGFDDMQDNIPF